jgi:hypothetical protein
MLAMERIISDTVLRRQRGVWPRVEVSVRADSLAGPSKAILTPNSPVTIEASLEW